MLSQAQRQAVKESWLLAVPVADTVADLFYRRLFEIAPQYQSLFSPNMGPQKKKLLQMLAYIVRSLDWPDDAWRNTVDEEDDPFMKTLELGRRHIDLYRVPDEAYDAVGAALLWTLEYGLGEAFTPAVREAWTQLYVMLAQTMKMSRLAPAKSELQPRTGS